MGLSGYVRNGPLGPSSTGVSRVAGANDGWMTATWWGNSEKCPLVIGVLGATMIHLGRVHAHKRIDTLIRNATYVAETWQRSRPKRFGPRSDVFFFSPESLAFQLIVRIYSYMLGSLDIRPILISAAFNKHPPKPDRARFHAVACWMLEAPVPGMFHMDFVEVEKTICRNCGPLWHQLFWNIPTDGCLVLDYPYIFHYAVIQKAILREDIWILETATMTLALLPFLSAERREARFSRSPRYPHFVWGVPMHFILRIIRRFPKMGMPQIIQNIGPC